jgi:hypothetical protein
MPTLAVRRSLIEEKPPTLKDYITSFNDKSKPTYQFSGKDILERILVGGEDV